MTTTVNDTVFSRLYPFRHAVMLLKVMERDGAPNILLKYTDGGTDLGTIDSTTFLDLLWKVVWPICPAQPLWSGFMQADVTRFETLKRVVFRVTLVAFRLDVGRALWKYKTRLAGKSKVHTEGKMKI